MRTTIVAVGILLTASLGAAQEPEQMDVIDASTDRTLGTARIPLEID